MSEVIGALNFDDVKATSELRYTRPGTIDVFKITKIEFTKSKNKGTPQMVVTFQNKDSQFSDNFFLAGSTAEKTKSVLGRIQALIEYTNGKGATLSGTITTDQLNAKLLNKELALRVSGEISTNGKGFARLPFAGFGKPKDEVSFLSFAPDELEQIQKVLDAQANSRSSSSADSEGGSEGGAQAETNVPSENF